MEQIKANVNQLKSALSKPSDALWNDTVIKALGKCALHFRGKDDPLTDVEIEIFLDGLRGYESYRIQEAFDLCLTHCDFMPKLADVFRLMPEKATETKPLEKRALIRTWVEDYDEHRKVRYFEYEGGYREARFERV